MLTFARGYIILYWIIESSFTPQSNSGTKAKEELAAATNAVQVTVLTLYALLNSPSTKLDQLMKQRAWSDN